MSTSGGNQSGAPGVFVAPPPTGVAATDQAAIAALVTQAAVSGGTVRLQAGTYAVSSSSRTDTVTVAANNTHFTDASITAGDVGKYVLGPTNTNPLKIVSVVAGVSFITDKPSFLAITAAAVQIVAPAIFLPPGVNLEGQGRYNTTNFFALGANITVTTKILDSGTGVTVLLAGGQQTASSTGYGAEWKITALGIWGGGPTVAGTTICGVFAPNGTWLLFMDRVSCEFHGIAGFILDGNMNSIRAQLCSFNNNGTAGATVLTGGVLAGYYAEDTSASIELNNCTIFQNFGIGVGAIIFGFSFGQPGGISLTDSQIVSTQASAYAGGGTGWGCLFNGGAQGTIHMHHCWLGTNASGDVWNNGGSLSMVNCSVNSPVTNQINNVGYLNILGGYSNQAAGQVAANTGTINVMGFQTAGAALTSGGAASSTLRGIGTTQGVYLNGTAYTNP